MPHTPSITKLGADNEEQRISHGDGGNGGPRPTGHRKWSEEF